MIYYDIWQVYFLIHCKCKFYYKITSNNNNNINQQKRKTNSIKDNNLLSYHFINQLNQAKYCGPAAGGLLMAKSLILCASVF